MSALTALLLLVSTGTQPQCGSHARVRGDSVWYERSVSRSLTSGALPDSLVLRAVGRHVDSLCVTFEIRGRGKLLFREQWLTTSYFYYDGLVDTLSRSYKHRRVWQELTDFFADTNFAFLDTAMSRRGQAVVHPSEARRLIGWEVNREAVGDSLYRSGVSGRDSARVAYRLASRRPLDNPGARAVWEDMVRRRPLTFMFFAGGEKRQRVAWSERRSRFYTVFSCC